MNCRTMATLFALSGVMACVTAAELQLGGKPHPTVYPGAAEHEIFFRTSDIPDEATLELTVRPVAKEPFASEQPQEPCAVARLPLKPEGSFSVAFSEVGFYELTLRALKDGTVVAETRSHAAVVPPPEYERPKELGTTTHFAHGGEKGALPLTFELLKLGGFSRCRDDLFWEGWETAPGKYAAPERLEKAVDTALEYGIRPLLVFGYVNNRAYPGQFPGKPFPRSEAMIQAYRDAGVAAVKYFKGRVFDWEMWNEPIGVDPAKEYLPAIRSLYPAIKAVDKRITAISCGGAGAGGGPGGEMIVPILNAGGVEYQDAFSIHPYVGASTPEFGYPAPGSTIGRVAIPSYVSFLTGRANSNPKADGSKLTLWVTELGWYTGSSKGAVSEWMQAAYAARMLLMFRASGLNGGLFWYDFQDDGADPANREHRFGVIRLDYSPKPAYQAFAVAASVLENLPFERAMLDEGEGGVKAYCYGNRDKRVLAVWNTGTTPGRVRLKMPRPLKAIDWAGREIPFSYDAKGFADLTVSPLPQYLILKEK